MQHDRPNQPAYAPGPESDSRELIDAAAVAIVAINADARIVSANTAALDLLGRSEASLIGGRVHETLNSTRPVGDCELEAAVRAGRAVHYEHDTFQAGDGRPLAVWWAVNPRKSHDGLPAGAVLVFGDASSHRELAAASAAEREQGRADLAEARRNIAYLEWAAAISQAMSSTLDEVEVMRRLARLTVGRLADVTIVSLIFEDGVIQRVGGAVADGVAVDIDEVLGREEVSTHFERGSATYRAATATDVLELTGDQLTDPGLLSPQSRALLAAVGATNALSVALRSRGHLVGALVLIRLDGSPFDDIDKLAANDVCMRAALAVDSARLFRAQADIATRLQRALLPALPANSPVRAAVRYLPARDRFDVGGDWYDLVHLPDGRVALVIGDVAGHDLAAGTTMSAIRNLLRGVSVVTRESPAQVLKAVDATLDPLAIDGTATVLLAHLTPHGERDWMLRWSNAGHMPPLLLTATGDVDVLAEVHGPLLGTGQDHHRTESRLVIPAGSTLVLYTDGLVETRSEPVETGLVRLRRSAVTLAAPRDDPDAVADELLAGNHVSVEDDTAMLVCYLPERAARD